MARLIQPLFGNILYSFSSCSRTFPNHLLQPQLEEPVLKITRNSRFQTTQQRAYISEMRNSAFEGHILKLLRNEIQYELERCPAAQPVAKFYWFTVDDRPGEK